MRPKALQSSSVAPRSRAASCLLRKPAIIRVHKRRGSHVRAGLLPDTDQSAFCLYPYCCDCLYGNISMRIQNMPILPSHMHVDYRCTTPAFNGDAQCSHAVVSAAESIGGAASNNARELQGLAADIHSATETLGAYLPWPLADPTVALGSDIANIVGLQPTWEGVGRLLVSGLH